jgi:hypothetical protein
MEDPNHYSGSAEKNNRGRGRAWRNVASGNPSAQETKSGPVIMQFVVRIKGLSLVGQTGITGTYPTQCHHDGKVLSI